MHPAVGERDEVVGVAGGEVEVVQHHHDGRAAGAVEVGEQIEHVDLVAHVEEGRRFVEQQQRRSAARAPWRSTRAGAARRRARRRCGRPARPSRWPGAPRRRPRRPRPASGSACPDAGRRPRPTRSATVMPSGAIGDCGSRPRVRASCLAGIACTALPSSSTWPPRGASRRDIERSSVDLPQALAPTIAVTRPGGTTRSSSCSTARSLYPTVSRRASRVWSTVIASLPLGCCG